METQMEEESISRLNVIILGIIMVVVLAMLIDIIFSGETGFVQNIVCGMVSWLPGGALVSSYLKCGVVPV